jgi:hypothetical protein
MTVSVLTNYGHSAVRFGKVSGSSDLKKLDFNTYKQQHPEKGFLYDFDAREVHAPSGKRNWMQKLLIFPNRMYQALTRHNPVFQKIKKWFKKSEKKKEDVKPKNFLQKIDAKISEWMYKKWPKLKEISELGGGCVYAKAGHPSCSEGMIILIDHYGDGNPWKALKGAWKGFKRVGKCSVSTALELKRTGKIEEPVYTYA